MKKGFVFIETLVVLVVLMISVVGLYTTYIKISSNIDSRKYYDNISDLYKTDILRKNINTDLINSDTLIEISKDNCTNYMNSTCNKIMNSLNVEKIYINSNNINSLLLSETYNLKNSMKEYLRTINSNKEERIIIVNFKYDNKNYYASLKI